MKYAEGYAAELIGAHWPKAVDGNVNLRSCWPSIDVDRGWTDVLVFGVQIAEAYDKDFVIYQIKEKFGGLRFYTDLPMVVETMIEHLALNVCEACGEFGNLSYTDAPSPWLKTLCSEHQGDYGYLPSREWRAKYRSDDC